VDGVGDSGTRPHKAATTRTTTASWTSPTYRHWAACSGTPAGRP